MRSEHKCTKYLYIRFVLASKHFILMKKLIVFLVFLIFCACTNAPFQNQCLPNILVDEIINLNLPEFIDLNVTNGSATTTLGNRRIVIINRGSTFKAFDLECPEQHCASPMSYDGLKLICTCNQEEYNPLSGGAPLTEGIECFAKEYFTQTINSNTIRISNF